MRVLTSILNACNAAVYNNKPIIMVRTDEIEIIRRIVESDRLVVRVSEDPAQHPVDEPAYVLTRAISNKPINLFESNGAYAREVVNVHYIPPSELNEFAGRRGVSLNVSNGKLDVHAERKGDNYGRPECSKGYDFPSLYIIQYRKTAEHDPYQIWASSDLMPFIDRFLQDNMNGSAISGSIILLFGEDAVIPNTYKNYCEIVDEPYPERDEIIELLEELGSSKISKDSIPKIAETFLGFRLVEIERIIRAMSITPLDKDVPDKGCIFSDERAARKFIQRRKEQKLKSENLLELSKDSDLGKSARTGSIIGNDSGLGGMEQLKAWVEKQARAIRDADTLRREAGVNPPKGILACGVPGCGKSAAAKELASTLNIPLLKMDVGKLMGKYVGESEHNMDKALRQAESMSPCVLFIDELDKGFSGTKRGGEDSGQIKRMFGTLLGWMQDCKKPCFIFATANDISELPKEFFRSGRFDGLFSLYMPTEDECVDILLKKMKGAEKTCKRRYLFQSGCMDEAFLRGIIRDFGHKNKFVTGADIEKLTNMALRSIWNGNTISNAGGISKEIWKQELLHALDKTSVYGESMDNQNSIAVCYIRLIRGNFSPAANLSLFEKDDYQCEYVEKKELPASYKVTIKERYMENEYDRKMRAVLAPLMERYGSYIENASLRSLI